MQKALKTNNYYSLKVSFFKKLGNLEILISRNPESFGVNLQLKMLAIEK
jgi:hypothetical protein